MGWYTGFANYMKSLRNRRLNDIVEWWTWERYQRTRADIERWTWKRYKQGEDKWLYIFYLWNYLADLQYKQNKIEYSGGGKNKSSVFVSGSFFLDFMGDFIRRNGKR